MADDFSARKEGRKIGSWDNFDEEEDDFGSKGGWAGDDPIEDPEFASTEAARIRRRVTEAVDRELQDKEVWFVATGAEEVGTVGMKAFLAEYGSELKDAVIINIDNIGAGALYWVTAEGMARRYKSDRRIVSLARRVSRERGMLVRPRAYRGLVDRCYARARAEVPGDEHHVLRHQRAAAQLALAHGHDRERLARARGARFGVHRRHGPRPVAPPRSRAERVYGATLSATPL